MGKVVNLKLQAWIRKVSTEELKVATNQGLEDLRVQHEKHSKAGTLGSKAFSKELDLIEGTLRAIKEELERRGITNE